MVTKPFPPTHAAAHLGEDAPLLTPAMVRALWADIQSDKKLLADLPARIQAKESRFEKAIEFVPVEFRESLFGGNLDPKYMPSLPLELDNKPEPRFKNEVNGVETWTGAIISILNAARRGLTHPEIIQALKQRSRFAELLPTNMKTYYNSIANLRTKGEIEKDGELFYAQDVIEALRATGAPLPASSKSSAIPENSAAAQIISVLCKTKRPMTAAEIKQELSNIDGVSTSLIGGSSHLFNVLKTMTAKRQIVRDDSNKTYMCPSED